MSCGPRRLCTFSPSHAPTPERPVEIGFGFGVGLRLAASAIGALLSHSLASSRRAEPGLCLLLIDCRRTDGLQKLVRRRGRFLVDGLVPAARALRNSVASRDSCGGASASARAGHASRVRGQVRGLQMQMRGTSGQAPARSEIGGRSRSLSCFVVAVAASERVGLWTWQGVSRRESGNAACPGSFVLACLPLYAMCRARLIPALSCT